MQVLASSKVRLVLQRSGWVQAQCSVSDSLWYPFEAQTVQGFWTSIMPKLFSALEVIRFTWFSNWHCNLSGVASLPCNLQSSILEKKAQNGWVLEVSSVATTVKQVRGVLITDTRDVYSNGSSTKGRFGAVSSEESQNWAGLFVRWVNSQARFASSLTKGGRGFPNNEVCSTEQRSKPQLIVYKRGWTYRILAQAKPWVA